MARFLYRLCCGGLFGAQLFFSAVAAQIIFPPEVAALPAGHPRRQLAADLVGAMLARLDAATIGLAAIAVLCAVFLGRRRSAIAPLLAGLCAGTSAAVITPAIHSMRAAGATGTGRFGMLHAISAALLVVEMALMVAAVWRTPDGEPAAGA